METVIGEIISDYGSFGILILFAIYIIYEKLKQGDKAKSSEQFSQNMQGCADHILQQITSVRDDMRVSISSIDEHLKSLKENFNIKHELLSKRLINLEDKINNQSDDFIQGIKEFNVQAMTEHNERLLHQIELGPKIHRILGRYLDIIECDHIVLGAFHNGVSSLNGIPFAKFDIIAEKFHPSKNTYDVEFAPMYKNIDIFLHNKLPVILIQDEYIHFDIYEDDDQCELDEIDDVLYRRLLGRGINQISLHILKDDKMIPIGFLACIKYNRNNMVERELKNCATEIEDIYNQHSKKLINK